MSPLRTRVWDGDAWRPLGGLDAPVDPDRTLLVRGAYNPDASHVGPLPSRTTFTQVEANSSGAIALTTPNTVYDGYEFWGEVSFRAPGIILRNCKLRGPAPGKTIKPLIKNYGPGYYHGVLEHCLLDPYPWYTQRGYPMMTAATYINRPGLHGGDVEMRWCHIRNVEDGIAQVQSDPQSGDTGNTGFNSGTGFVVPAGERFLVIDRCLIEEASFVNGPDYQALSFAQSGGYPHCDAFQFNIGKNVWVTGSRLGGVRTPSAYQTWGTDASNPAQSKDYGNAAFMVQQEAGITDPTNPRWVTNVLIEDSFVGGGVSTFNFNYTSGNTLAGVTVRRCKLYERQAGWGTYMHNGSMSNVNSGLGRYIAKGVDPSALQVVWQDNEVLETGAPIPW